MHGRGGVDEPVNGSSVQPASTLSIDLSKTGVLSFTSLLAVGSPKGGERNHTVVGPLATSLSGRSSLWFGRASKPCREIDT